MKVRLRYCEDAESEHKESVRQYAHTGHRKNTICLAQAFDSLPEKIKRGILFHELGHLFGADGEEEADRLAWTMFGVKIKRIDSVYGNNIESV